MIVRVCAGLCVALAVVGAAAYASKVEVAGKICLLLYCIYTAVNILSRVTVVDCLGWD